MFGIPIAIIFSLVIDNSIDYLLAKFQVNMMSCFEDIANGELRESEL